MLKLLTQAATRDCDGMVRRDFLRVGALGLGGLTLPWLFRQQSALAGDLDYLRHKSVVLLFLSGGASHIETFNPNTA